ncbi:hypothetical protein Q6348_07660 [Isoptericola sp. b441]|uniref:DoxX family protein n=1 Tax=Actinotalea lenta TaxID=3064654 RepID=A0ABT9D873_9CELL|nr:MULTISPECIES: hypothetical protein [unclassified Isoptericola]MDO8107072.1 hypothetical protein [Isoptericola sp. b441]MDO8121214.1 hypothetical protein [Isoptericola sp. b490]
MPRLSDAPIRLASGAFILNSGLTKWSADEATAEHLHGRAVGAYPFLASLDAPTFVRALSVAEITVGSLLLSPLVPSRLAGAALAGFSGGLLGLYWRTPGTHRGSTDLRPTPQGVALAKDVWLAGIAGTLLLRRRHKKS